MYAGGRGSKADVPFFQILKMTITLFQQKPSLSQQLNTNLVSATDTPFFTRSIPLWRLNAMFTLN